MTESRMFMTKDKIKFLGDAYGKSKKFVGDVLHWPLLTDTWVAMSVAQISEMMGPRTLPCRTPRD